MNKEKIQKVNRELLQKTGIDFSRYKSQELTDTIANAVTFPMFFAKAIRRPIGILLLLIFVAIVVADNTFQKLFLIFPGLVLAVINGFLIGLVIFIRRIRNDMSKVFMISSELTLQAVKDISTAKSKLKDSAANFPNLFEIFKGINTVVILPMVLQTLEGKIPIVGRLLARITERFFGLVEAMLLIGVKNRVEQVQELISHETPEQITEWIQRVEQIVEIAKTRTIQVVNKASLVIAFPLMTVSTVVFLASAAILYAAYTLLGSK